MFDPMPKFEPQNTNIVFDGFTDSQFQPGSGQPTVSDIDGIPGTPITQTLDPVVVSRQNIEMPKPVAIPPTGSARWNRKSGLPKPKRAGKPNRRKSPNREPVKRDLPLQGNGVPASNDGLSPGITLTPSEPIQNIGPAGLSFLVLEDDHNRRCPFRINFSNLSGLFMTRDEFDLMFFLPALQTNFMDSGCRTEGMKLYLDWLSFLRDRTFVV